jgi:hypothetical protein
LLALQKKIILVLDDSSEILEDIKGFSVFEHTELRHKMHAYQVETIINLTEGMSFYEKNKENIKMIITDLKMPQYLGKYKHFSTTLMGWYWLLDLYEGKTLVNKDIVIFSAYCPDLNNHIGEASKDEFELLESVKLVSKGFGEGVGFAELRNVVKKLL